ncbi:MAG: putative selenate reductase subunit YgfK [Holophaga sp.]|nr:putative selenate reductase subunit YgfK [Holophaga sp.]
MHKAFRPAPLELLARWIFSDLDAGGTVLGIPIANFEIPDPKLKSTLMGRELAAPLGVAAGPHSQLAQNIIAAWLCGARFMELKTVQILDELAVSRPCIDSADETFNCEWSQELKLEQSFDEYLKAWVLIHALAHRLGLQSPGTLFAMSVGYNLEGVKQPRVQAFIASMRNASGPMAEAIETVAKVYPAVRDIVIPTELSNHVTLSTMHGCPPSEIERIALHLLKDLKLHTWVKLNPTLLGPERLRGLLNETFGYGITVPDEAFAHDPSFVDAMAMVKRLAAVAAKLPQSFGLKLSNTLEVENHRGVFPEGEKMMYLSGKALHPITLTLANAVTKELNGAVPISFCGGADALNFADLVADGMTPITVCTDLLKPGGYARLQQYVVNLENALSRTGAQSLEAYIQVASGGLGARASLAHHASVVAQDTRFARRPKPLTFKGPRALGSFDCVAAPCQEACPAHQNIPDYLWLVAQGRPSEAMDVILRTNPQPGVTGSVCEHPCTERCVRNFYDAPLAIREVKRYAFEHGRAPMLRAGKALGIKVAIVGAGPAGLAAAYHLARMGFAPELFEARTEMGGMVQDVIPGYRLDGKALSNDLDRLRQLGVSVHLGVALGRDIHLQGLRDSFSFVFLGVGAQRGRRLGIEGEEAEGVMDALRFLQGVADRPADSLGNRILVVGGGNSAMDAARSARRLSPGAEVNLVYRRTRAEMPADPEEIHACLEEGIGLIDLRAPVRVAVEGGRAVGLICQTMRLGAPDASGRPRPEAVAGSEAMIAADTIIPALGQEVVLDFLDGLDLELTRSGTLKIDPATGETSLSGVYAGGDAVHGPASVVQALADGLAAAEAMGRLHGVALPVAPALVKDRGPLELLARKAARMEAQTVPVLPVPARNGFREVIQSFGETEARSEADRCLACDEVCSLCVTVCPNRAHQGYTVPITALELPELIAVNGQLQQRGTRTFPVNQSVQTYVLADFCNACGNCVPFCPTAGSPFRDKPRVWMDADGFAEDSEDAFRVSHTADGLVIEGRLAGHAHRLVWGPTAEYQSEQVRMVLDPVTGVPQTWETLALPAEAQMLNLAPLATLLTLRHAASSGALS